MIIDYSEIKNPKDNEGRTPFHLAAEKGHLPICEVIFDNNSKDINGQTPLHLAAKSGHLIICKLISEKIKKLGRK